MGQIPGERVLPPFKKAVTGSTEKEPANQATPSNEYQFFGLAHNQSSAVGFKILFADGRITAIYYHDIISPVEYDGEGTITLQTPSLTITIKGKNLRALFDNLFENRMIWIKEPATSFIQVTDGQPEIEAIQVIYKE